MDESRERITTRDHELPSLPSDTARPDLRWLAWSLIAVGIAFFLAIGIVLQVKLGNGAASGAPPGITQIHLPAEFCPAPETGQVLVITVFAIEPDGKSRQAVCQIVAGRTI